MFFMTIYRAHQVFATWGWTQGWPMNISRRQKIDFFWWASLFYMLTLRPYSSTHNQEKKDIPVNGVEFGDPAMK